MSGEMLNPKLEYQIYKLQQEEILERGNIVKRVSLEPLGWPYDSHAEAFEYLMTKKYPEFGRRDEVTILPVYTVEL